MRLGAALLTLAVTGICDAPALACSPALDFSYRAEPEKPAEVSSTAWAAHLAIVAANEERARKIASAWSVFYEQERLWNEADQVFLARIEATTPRRHQTFWGGFVDVPDVELLRVLDLKGQGGRERFRLGIQEWTSCGPGPSWDVFGRNPGEAFVVYVRGGSPSQQTVRDVIAVGALVESQVRAALGLHQ